MCFVYTACVQHVHDVYIACTTIENDVHKVYNNVFIINLLMYLVHPYRVVACICSPSEIVHGRVGFINLVPLSYARLHGLIAWGCYLTWGVYL